MSIVESLLDKGSGGGAMNTLNQYFELIASKVSKLFPLCFEFDHVVNMQLILLETLSRNRFYNSKQDLVIFLLSWT